MRKIGKQELQRLYEAPPPRGKRKFFRELELQPMSTCHILWQQLSYVSKWSWVLAVFSLMAILYLNYFYGSVLLGAALALMPFLAVNVVTECVRSGIYGMEELEMSTRFSLKSILLMRMGIVGFENLILAIAAAILIQGSIFQTALYLFAPYLLTTYGCFLAVRKILSKEVLYTCVGIAVAVNAIMGMGEKFFPWIFHERYMEVWLLAVVLLGCLTLWEGRKTIRQEACFPV